MSKEIQERIKAWEEKHGKRIEDLNAEETVEAPAVSAPVRTGAVAAD